MTELVDKVAEAIYDAAPQPFSAPPWAALRPDLRAAYRRKARAALALVVEALREPTLVMREAGETAIEDGIDSTTDSYGSHDLIYKDVCALAAWEAMLAAFARSALAPAETREG